MASSDACAVPVAMNTMIGAVTGLAASFHWLVTANFILSVLLALWMLRYRRLYYTARVESEQIRETIDTLSEGVYRSTMDGRQMQANQALVKLNGYDSEEELLSSVNDIATEWYVDPTRRDDFRTILDRDGVVEDFVSEIYRHKTRERIWITESARLVRDKRTNKPLFYEGSVREITETVERLRLEEQFRKLMHEVPGALFQYSMKPDRSIEMTYLSPGYERITGIPVAEAMKNPEVFMDCVPDADRDSYRHSLSDAWGRQTSWEIEHRFVTRNGDRKWLRVSATPEFRGSEVVWHGYMSDISQRKKSDLEVEKLAYFDTLTELPNRRLFFERLTSAIEACRENGQRAALLFVDLDNFKTLNDTQGHDVGDQYLVEVAKRLRGCVDEDDTVARIGGDEFVVLTERGGNDATAARKAISTANRINSALRQRFEMGNLCYRSSASVGVVIFDGQENKADEILKRADIAMYEAKASGRDSLAIFDPASLNKANERYRLLADLRAAISRGGDELELHYQPIVDASGQIISAEALLRWKHPEFGIVLPDRFVQLADQFGLACDLAMIVFEKGISSLASWAGDSQLAGLRLSINTSSHAFANERFASGLGQLLKAHGVAGSMLTIEITEHVAGQNRQVVAQRMRELKALGIRLSLDDFGAGNSSLNYLKRLPFDEVKIDGSFVADIEAKDSDRALIQTILGMTKTLGLSAVAEQVETASQEQFLKDNGCDTYQGWRYAKAMPDTDFRAHVRKTSPRPATALTAGTGGEARSA